MASESSLSVKQVRRAIKELNKTGEIEAIGTNKFNIIKVCNYGIYQDLDSEKAQQKHNALLYTKNEKNEKNKLKENIQKKGGYTAERTSRVFRLTE
ncbi:MAG: hypothetical protein PHD45_06170 [Bacteroidales bacterium]|nr:hypothetical protein [Bacteroidales bacterium]